MQLFETETEAVKELAQGREISLRMAVGAAVYEPETDKEYADVFRRADSAMYEDKKRKKAIQ